MRPLLGVPILVTMRPRDVGRLPVRLMPQAARPGIRRKPLLRLKHHCWMIGIDDALKNFIVKTAEATDA